MTTVIQYQKDDNGFQMSESRDKRMPHKKTNNKNDNNISNKTPKFGRRAH